MLGQFWDSLIEKDDEFDLYLGVSFETSSAALIEQIPSALSVFAEAVENFIKIYNVRNQVTSSIVYTNYVTNIDPNNPKVSLCSTQLYDATKEKF